MKQEEKDGSLQPLQAMLAGISTADLTRIKSLIDQLGGVDAARELFAEMQFDDGDLEGDIDPEIDEAEAA